jgi:hypothetical protein
MRPAPARPVSARRYASVGQPDAGDLAAAGQLGRRIAASRGRTARTIERAAGDPAVAPGR